MTAKSLRRLRLTVLSVLLTGLVPAAGPGQSAQSPIDLRSQDSQVVDVLAALEFQYAPLATFTLENTGETARANVRAGDGLLQVSGATYQLLQFHWHTPAEHRLEGATFPLEMHLVHRAQNGELLVIGVFFRAAEAPDGEGGVEPGSDPNKHFEPIFSKLPEDSAEGGTPEEVTNFDLNALLSGRLDSFRYNGSLTTPPFTEGVRWIVLTDPITLSQDQIDGFAALFPEGNSREVQPLNNRLIATDHAPVYAVNRAFDFKNGKSYLADGPDGAEPVDDLNNSSEEPYKVELETQFWWEAEFQDTPPSAGNPAATFLTLHYRPESDWLGMLRAEFYDGAFLLASADLPADGTNNPSFGKGQRGIFHWNLSAAVTQKFALDSGKVRIINNSSNGKKVWLTYASLKSRPALPGAPPTAMLTGPPNGATFRAPANIVLTAVANNFNGTIARVRFFQDGMLLGQDSTSPYSFNWNNVGIGTYALTARAIDSTGVIGAHSPVVNVTVTNVPAPSLSSTPMVESVFHSKDGKTYGPPSPDGRDPFDEINSAAENRKMEADLWWWEWEFVNPPSAANPVTATVIVSARAEADWIGNAAVELWSGNTLLARMPFPAAADSLRQLDWDVSAYLTTSALVNEAKLRIYNSSSNGKKLFVNYSVLKITQ